MDKATELIWTDQPLVLESDPPPTYREEARLWEKAVYPFGNGRLGCTAFGEPCRERIQFNQDSLWVGNEDNTGGYQPFGDIYIEMPRHDAYTDYRRELDLARAVQTITYRVAGVGYSRQYFSSYPAQLVVLRFTADRPGSLSGAISMGSVHEIPVVADADTLVMAGDTSNFWWWRFQVENREQRLIAGREYASDENIDLDFEARVKVLHEGGSVNVEGDRLLFTECTALTLLLAADTNYVADRERGWRGPHPHARLVEQLAAAQTRTFEELLGEHVADYQSLFGRLSLRLGNSVPKTSELPTPERLSAYAAQVREKGESEDHALEVLLYQYARYLMISSSRSGHGCLPSNLQGIWLINKHPAWRCDFHTDINVQMNYWFTSASNLVDCFAPLAQWIDSIREVRKEETRRVLGVERGWLMRSENGVFGGSTWHFQKGDSAWLCQNLWDHYAFTQDKEYLARYAYPVMKEISEFWIDHLKELPDGTLVAPDGRSPEHGPVGVDGVTYDQQLCWDLFNNTIEACEILGVDDDLRDELVDRRDRLLGPQVGRWGQLQEWMEDIDDPEDDHRHINHLIGVYPGRRIHPATTPELARAATVSLVARRNHGEGHPAWSRVWKACMFARLQDGDSAYSELATTLATHIYGNLWGVHPPFQIDANFGYAAAVNEMMVQSHLGQGQPGVDESSACVIDLLPALPAAWPDGSLTGVRVRGGFEVDIAWKNSGLAHATVRGISNRSDTCTLMYGKLSATVQVAKGDAVAVAVGQLA